MTSSDTELARLIRRIDHLEARLRRARWLGVAAIASAGLLLAGAASRPKDLIAGRLEARELAIRDKNGVLRAALLTGPSVGASSVDLDAGISSGLVLYDDAGKMRAELAIGPDNQPRLRLADAADLRRFSVSLGARMFSLDVVEEGRLRAHLATYRGAGEGASELVVQGPDERSLTLRADAHEAPALLVRDAQGTIVNQIPPPPAP